MVVLSSLETGPSKSHYTLDTQSLKVPTKPTKLPASDGQTIQLEGASSSPVKL